MARPLRIEYPGAYYHVMNRVAGRKLLFRRGDVLALFLRTLEEALAGFEVRCHAWCLMGNHYHLLLETPHGNLSRAMRHLNSVFTQRFNRERGRDGPLFRGRYRAQLIERDAYLLRVSRYIHRNPLEAGVAADLARCRWSSFAAYAGVAREPPWLVTREVLSQLGGSRRRYRSYVESDEADDLPEPGARNPVLGSKAFRRQVLEGGEPGPEIARPAPERADPEAVLDRVAEAFGVERSALLNASRGRGQRNPARAVAMLLCLRRAGLSQREVAKLFGVGHYATVAVTIQRLRHWMEREPALRHRAEQAGVDANGSGR